MYGVAGAHRPIFTESDAYFYNLDDPNLGSRPNLTHSMRKKVVHDRSRSLEHSYLFVVASRYRIPPSNDRSPDNCTYIGNIVEVRFVLCVVRPHTKSYDVVFHV